MLSRLRELWEVWIRVRKTVGGMVEQTVRNLSLTPSLRGIKEPTGHRTTAFTLQVDSAMALTPSYWRGLKVQSFTDDIYPRK